MSSTARGGQRSPADFYATPAWAVHRFLERCKLPGGLWYEPAAGEGAIIKAVNVVRSDVSWRANELRKTCKSKLTPLVTAGGRELTIGNFLTVLQPTHLQRPAVTITNPPFSLAMDFIEHSLGFSTYVIHLLRLNFFGSEKRNAFFQMTMPDVYVVPDRISFTADGKADSIEYGWFVWGPHRLRKHGEIQVLNHTPVAQRRKAA